MSFASGWRGTNTIARENEDKISSTRCRRADMQQMVPAELAILQAMQEVEKVGASIGLTNAVLKLQEAKDLVSDFIDGK